jgi:hypothetical protein
MANALRLVEDDTAALRFIGGITSNDWTQVGAMNPPLHPSQEGNLQPLLQTKLYFDSQEGSSAGSSSCKLPSWEG